MVKVKLFGTLRLDSGVKELYADIDTAVDGLGTILQNELAK